MLIKKEYKKPRIELFPVKCHVSSLSASEPESMDTSRRNLLLKTGLTVTVSHLLLYGGSDAGPSFNSASDTWNK